MGWNYSTYAPISQRKYGKFRAQLLPFPAIDMPLLIFQYNRSILFTRMRYTMAGVIKMKKLTTRQLCITGLLMAVIIVMTMIRLPIPMMQGYPHIGDAGILLAGLILGPMAALPAAIGSALTDLIYGYMIYIPFTLVIKGAMGWAAGKFLHRGFRVKNVLTVIAIAAFMVLAYFLTDMVLYGWAAAAGSVLGNISQALATIALGGAVLAMPVERMR